MNASQQSFLSRTDKSQQTEQMPDIPLSLIIILILLSSLAGELYRADKQRSITKALMRVLVRSFASTMVGIIALFYCLHRGMDLMYAGAVTGSVAMIGADVVIAIMTMIFKRKAEA